MIIRYELVHQSNAITFRGIIKFAGQANFQSFWNADKTRQPLRSTRTRQKTKPHFTQSKSRPFRRYTDVTRQTHQKPCADGITMKQRDGNLIHRRNHRCRSARNRRVLRLALHERRFRRFDFRRILPRAILDISAYGKRALAICLEYDNLNVWVFFRRAAIVNDRPYHFAVHRIQRLRTIQRDPGGLISNFV